jgi:hypothetical protein
MDELLELGGASLDWVICLLVDRSPLSILLVSRIVRCFPQMNDMGNSVVAHAVVW